MSNLTKLECGILEIRKINVPKGNGVLHPYIAYEIEIHDEVEPQILVLNEEDFKKFKEAVLKVWE